MTQNLFNLFPRALNFFYELSRCIVVIIFNVNGANYDNCVVSMLFPKILFHSKSIKAFSKVLKYKSNFLRWSKLRLFVTVLEVNSILFHHAKVMLAHK